MRLTSIIFGLLVSGALAVPALADKRVALVIGNSAYRETTPLKNTRNDATDMAAALKRLGFQVLEGIDLEKRAMEQRSSCLMPAGTTH